MPVRHNDNDVIYSAVMRLLVLRFYLRDSGGNDFVWLRFVQVPIIMDEKAVYAKLPSAFHHEIVNFTPEDGGFMTTIRCNCGWI